MLNKYLKCSVWRLALRHDIYIYMSLGFKRLITLCLILSFLEIRAERRQKSISVELSFAVDLIIIIIIIIIIITCNLGFEDLSCTTYDPEGKYLLKRYCNCVDRLV